GPQSLYKLFEGACFAHDSGACGPEKHVLRRVLDVLGVRSRQQPRSVQSVLYFFGGQDGWNWCHRESPQSTNAASRSSTISAPACPEPARWRSSPGSRPAVRKRSGRSRWPRSREVLNLSAEGHEDAFAEWSPQADLAHVETEEKRRQV